MGSASSKFKKYLVHGDEFAAMQVFQGSPELRRNLDPNLSYGESHTHNTPLHYAAKHAMKHLLRTFLNDLGGNPNKKNAHNETALHLACRLGQQKGGGFGAQERRAACVALLLQWRGPPVAAQPSVANTTTATQPQTPQSAQSAQQQQSVQPNSQQQQQQQPATPATRERVQINARDQEGNTALHMAAGTGLRRCVELLLSAPGCELFIENFDKLTPCDLAMRNQHHDIARLLEARMVFADNSDLVNEDELNGGQGEQEEVYSGLRTQDLQEAKDQLLVETSDMLHIPLFTAEALLRDNEWSREALLEKWMKDPVQCCQMAGVQAPASALHHFGSIELCSPTNRSIDSSGSDSESKSDILCEICYTCTVPSHPQLAMSCKHNFCTSCWERYLNEKISAGDAHHILCPAYQCHILVPAELIERLVSPDMARRYLQFDIKAFVETNRSIKWCPMAGCGRAVRLPECEQTPPPGPEGEALITPRPPPTSHAVDCGNSHFFCWECLGEAHAPCGCEQWAQWQHKIAQVKPEELRASCDESEAAANCLWLVTNSKPCPNCKSPIQKNEGCNHMKCSKCKFDFCWVCQESWKRHSSATGGYFRCNRWEAAAAADARRGEAAAAAATRSAHVEHVTRFVHYYTRFRNHENSRALEQPLLTAARRKMELLRGELERTGQSEDCGEKGTKFIEDGVRELLKARRILCGSYVYGYYLEDNGYNKTIFEFMQNELEEVTEKLSEMIARPYLRTPKSVIVQTTALARRKRHEFVRAVAKGLVPPETPPSMRTVKRRKLNDIQMHQLRQIDPSNPWVKEAQDRLYEWPEYESDEEAEVNKALAVSILGECTRNGCTRPRARNIQTGAILDYCSLRCSKTANGSSATELSSDYNMELVIALEMSRLQMIEDRMRQVTDIGHGLASVLERLGGSQSSTDPPGTSQPNQNSGTNDDQLKLAIQLSLQESTAALSKQLLQQEQQKLLQQQSQQSIDLVSTSTQAPEQSSSESPINNDTKPKTIKLTKATITGSSIDDTAPCGQLRINYDDSTIFKSSGDINKSGLIDENDMSCNRGQDLQTSTMNKTVDYFLKSLANQKIDLRRNIEETMQHRDCNLPTDLKNNDNKDASAYYKTSGISTGQRKEDGRFQIGDIHETGYIQFVTPDDINDDIFLEGDERLKRSHSTVIRRSGRGSRIRLGLAGTVVQAGNEPRYHLDSDHSSNHDEKCEEVARRLLALPSATIRARQFLLLQHQNHYNSNISSSANMDANTPGGISNDTPTSEETTDVKLAPEFYFSNHKISPLEDQNVFYQGQSSVEDTTTSDSLNEMCGSSLIQDDELNSKEILEEKFVYAPIASQDEYSLGSFKLRTYKKSPKLLRNSRNRRSNSAVEEENELFESSKCKHNEIENNVEPKLESSVIAMSNSYIVKTEHIQEPSSTKMNPLACLKAKLCSAHLPKTSYLTKMAVHKSIGLLSHTDMNASTSCNSTNVKQKQKSGMSQYGTKIFSKSTEKISTKTETSQNLLESHRKAFKLSGGKTKSQNLRIRICKSPPPIENSEVAKITSQSDPASNKPENVSKFRALETDSSNEYESETGIPKSPTLYISGVSISRTPEPKSPGLNFVMVDSNGRQSRSSSLTVPTPANNNSLSPSALNTNTELTVSSSSLNIPGSPEPYTPSMIRSMTPQTSFTNLRELATVQGLSPQRSPVLSSTASGKENSRPLHRPPRSTGSTPCRTRSGTSSCSNEGSGRRQHHDSTTSTSTTKSKSASEPEREREMFRFPKSSTDGALSSVLHVQESNLSSDDFHEALFLLERSPKTPRDSKRRRKVKKKDKESIGDCGRKEEASSVL